MECKYHPGEETINHCVLCNTPICAKCLSSSWELDYGLLCPKCLRALGLGGELG